MEQNLMEAAQAGNIDELYKSIRLDPNILKRIDGIPFFNTPLHVAAACGHTHFAIEIISLMPSFGRKLNPDGLSPLDLALRNQHYETVKRFIKFESELIRVQGRERLTPLHYVAKTNNAHLLVEFLCACPESIEDLTIGEETALHIAVKSSSLTAFNVLLKWLWWTSNKQLVNWIDEGGNTVLHIAVSTNQPEIVDLLLKKASFIKNEKNIHGLTALDIVLGLDADEANTEVVRNILRRARAAQASSLPRDDSLADDFISMDRYFERIYRIVLFWRRELSMEMRNVVLVVAVLIATATFQAVLSPPANNVFSSPFISEEQFIALFYSLNTIAFTASITVIIIVLQLRPYSWLLHASLAFLVASYGFSVFRLLSSSLLAGCLMAVSVTFSYLAYLVKFFFAALEMHKKSAFGNLRWLPESQSRLLKRRLELIHRFVD